MRNTRHKHSDPTLPRKDGTANPKAAQQRVFPTIGWLVDRGGDGVWLCTRARAARFKGQIQTGSWASQGDGTASRVRPFKYDPTGRVIIQGDYCTVVYLDGDVDKPVLIPGFVPNNYDDPDFIPPVPTDADPNALHHRMVRRDPTSGAVLGHVQVTGLDGGNQLELTVGGPAYGVGLTVAIDMDAGTVTVTRGGVTTNAVLGTFVTDVQAMAVEVQALAGALGIPVPNTAKVVSSPAIPTYLSTLLKIE